MVEKWINYLGGIRIYWVPIGLMLEVTTHGF